MLPCSYGGDGFSVRDTPAERLYLPWPKLLHYAGLRIKETKEVYEGEVTELTAEEVESATGGYAKTISHVIIGLKTVKGTKQLKLDPTIYERCVPAATYVS